MVWVIKVQCPAGTGMFSSVTMFRLALGPTMTPVCWIQGAVSMGLKWWCVTDYFCLLPDLEL